MQDYLGKIEKCLRPLPAPERADIVKEIQSEMAELLAEGKTAEEVMARLGRPDELAKAYLGDLITKDPSFRWTRVLALCAYYSLAEYGCWQLLVGYIKGMGRVRAGLSR